jgi:8-oxo-dGTP pyrophosphatase MutT (NUDIX family)
LLGTTGRVLVGNTKKVQAWTVASGIIIDRAQLLLVQNQRRNGSLDWSTPGGVVDPGEEVLEALQREVIEETSVVVDTWSHMLYSVDVDFVGRDMTLHAQVFQAAGYTGALHVDDPDKVVVDGRWVSPDQAHSLLATSPQWVAEPLRHYVTGLFDAPAAAIDSPGQWKYRVTGSGRDFQAELVHVEHGG